MDDASNEPPEHYWFATWDTNYDTADYDDVNSASDGTIALIDHAINGEVTWLHAFRGHG
jgi:hypothetical protein